MIRVLHVLSSLDSGGVEKLLQNYYSRMDREQFCFDFIVHGNHQGMLEFYFKQQGSQIFHVVPKSLNPVGNLIQINRIIKNGNYDVVHAHQDVMSALPLYFAKRSGVRMRISHCHVAAVPKRKPFESWLKKLLKASATHYMACSKAAGMWLFGEAVTASEQFRVLNNAISTESFVWNPELRQQMRADMGIKNELIIGNVARFSNQKNHEFLLCIFAELAKRYPDSRLLLVGDGPLIKQTVRQAKQKGISDKVFFLGVREDVGQLMQAMDVFVLPSRYEGFGIVLLEAQVSGMCCLTSDKVVPREVNVTGKVEYLSLEQDPGVWVERILSCEWKVRADCSREISDKGFEIEHAVSDLANLYLFG